MRNPVLAIYAIDLERLRTVPGSGSQYLLRALSREDDPPELQEAMRSLVLRGGPPFEGDPALLGIALHRVCQALGRRLADGAGESFTERVMTRVDAVVAPLALPFAPSDLAYAGPPIAGLPEPDDLPMFGYLEAALVREAHARWSQADPTDPDDDVDAFLVELGDWLEVAAAHGTGLVGVVH